MFHVSSQVSSQATCFLLYMTTFHTCHWTHINTVSVTKIHLQHPLVRDATCKAADKPLVLGGCNLPTHRLLLTILITRFRNWSSMGIREDDQQLCCNSLFLLHTWVAVNLNVACRPWYYRHISLTCDSSVTTQNVRFFRRDFWRVWCAIIFYECNNDTTALQWRVFQTALWHYTY